MSVQMNRVAAALKEWQQKQQEMEAFLGNSKSANNAIKREQRRYLDRIMIKFGDTKDEREKSMLRVVRPMVKDLRVQTQPRWLRVVNAIIRPVRVQYLRNKWETQNLQAADRIKDQAAAMKIRLSDKRLEEYLKSGLDKFSMATHITLSEKASVDFNFSVKRDTAGEQRLDAVEAIYTNQQDPARNRQVSFPIEIAEKLDINKMHHLLLGRPVKLDTWMQVDFDAKGKGTLREINHAKQFEVEAGLRQQLPSELKPKIDFEKVATALERGSIEDVTVMIGRKETVLLLKADPMNSKVMFMDVTGKEINPVAENRLARAMPAQQIGKGEAKELGHGQAKGANKGNSEEQGQSLS